MRGKVTVLLLPGALLLGGLIALAMIAPGAAQTSGASPTATPTSTPPATAGISLVQGWNLVGWAGATMPVGQALAGGPGGPQGGTTDVTADVSVVWGYDSTAQMWHAYFPASANVPGANDLAALTYLQGYFIYATNAAGWVVQTVEPGSGQQTAWTVPSSPSPMTGVAVLTDVRIGVHPGAGGYERIVFEFAGTERPQTTVEYVDSATGCASGLPVAVPGTAILQIAFVGADGHNSMGQATVPMTIAGPGTIIQEGILTCDFEAHVTWDFGLAGKHNFTVSTLTNPTRVVVDVKQ